jgi:predicted aspartyl protease
MGQNGSVFDVAVANRTITNQEDDMMPLVLAHGGEILLGTKTREEIHAVEQLLDGVIPGIEAQISIQNLLGKT